MHALAKSLVLSTLVLGLAPGAGLGFGPGSKPGGQLLGSWHHTVTPFTTPGKRPGWRVEFPGGKPLSSPAVQDGRVFVGDGFGSPLFHALDARTGKSLWTFMGSDPGPSAPVTEQGVVAYNTESCTVYVHEQETGRRLWSEWLGDPQMSRPAIAGNLLISSYPRGGAHHLAAFDLKTGAHVWKRAIASEAIGAPVVHGDQVLATSLDGTVYALGLRDGAPHWERPLRATSTPTVVGGRAWVAQRTDPELANRAQPVLPYETVNAVELEGGRPLFEEPRGWIDAPYLLTLFQASTLVEVRRREAESGQRKAWRQVAGEIQQALVEHPRPGQAARDLERRLAEFQDFIRPGSGGTQPIGADLVQLAEDVEHLHRALPDSPSEKKLRGALEEGAAALRYLSRHVEEEAPAGTVRISLDELRKEKEAALAHDASVGFSRRPEGARLDLAERNLGQETVKAVWGFQGSRPRLAEGHLVSVHGRKIRAVSPGSGKLVWETEVTTRTPSSRPAGPPAVGDGRLYLGTVDGVILCLDARDGAILWRDEVGGKIVSEPVLSGGVLYVGTENGQLIRLETGDPEADGWPMWGGSPGRNGGRDEPDGT